MSAMGSSPGCTHDPHIRHKLCISHKFYGHLIFSLHINTHVCDGVSMCECMYVYVINIYTYMYISTHIYIYISINIYM